jgi:hypothetical protein
MKKLLLLLTAVLTPSVATAQVEVRLTIPEVRVRVAPPPVRVEVQPERPSADQVWIAGHWARRGNRNEWIGGRWTRPPQDGMVWQRERWDQRDGAWYYAEGHWRWASPRPPATVYEPVVYAPRAAAHAPPRNLTERRTPSPFRGAVWIQGYWGWDGGQHTWVAGHWSAPQHRAAVWTPDRWTRAKGNGKGKGRGQAQWVLMPGHWSRR